MAVETARAQAEELVASEKQASQAQLVKLLAEQRKTLEAELQLLRDELDKLRAFKRDAEGKEAAARAALEEELQKVH